MSVPRAPFNPPREGNDSTVRRIKDLVNLLVYGSSGGRGGRKGDKLPGPLAASLSRAHLRTIREKAYHVCEKSDGDRRMLLVSPEDGLACLVDRAWAVHRLPNGPDLCDIWCKSRAPTLLDGELIMKPDGSAVYMLFDVIVVDGERVGDKHLRERLAAISDLRAKFKYRYERVPGVPGPSVRD
jgi:hypothetical protein